MELKRRERSSERSCLIFFSAVKRFQNSQVRLVFRLKSIVHLCGRNMNVPKTAFFLLITLFSVAVISNASEGQTGSGGGLQAGSSGIGIKNYHRNVRYIADSVKGPKDEISDNITTIEKMPDEVSVVGINYVADSVEGPKDEMRDKITKIKKMLNEVSALAEVCGVRRNCAELYKSGERSSGVYTIDPDGSGAFDVFCDQTTAGGGWTVFQKRLDGSVDFYRGWSDYKQGFGNLRGEYWLGLDKIYRLTKLVKNTLRVDLEDTKGKTAYAAYKMFAVTSERAKYQLSLGTYSGTAGDSLSHHRGASFSTKDRDNDQKNSENCAASYKGAWWYKRCHESNLNGRYHHGQHSSYADGVNWLSWKGHYYSAKRAEMKIRPVGF
ncbi:microfibril-associated glycoprotein 4-like isoform X3 [Montipora capricornis]|uniref:microfibril-associated glycoprotein 4-like isoform X3 n=1 Tax=Montipora capricornis TaxID=246305 RepID=UPI0035F17761